VRTLAQRSTLAAKEIKDLIEASAGTVDWATRRCTRPAPPWTAWWPACGGERHHGRDRAGSEEQRSGIEQVNQAIAQMDQVTQQNAALVEEATAAAGALQEQAQELTQVVGVFKL
jgi:methyl-accepting chemotaxis protein-2 (aspartate sensor receptor)